MGEINTTKGPTKGFNPKQKEEEEDGEGLISLNDKEAERALGQIPTEGLGSAREWMGEIKGVQASLNAEEQVTIFIPQAHPSDPQLPNVPVQINDYTISIPRGESVTVAKSVAELVYQGGYMNLKPQ